MFILGYRVEPLRFVPPFGSGQILAQNSLTTSRHIWALTYTIPHTHSMNMFNRPLDQFRFHWSCSLPFSNLKQVQDHRPWIHSPRHFHTTHSVSNCLHQIHSLLQMSWPSIAHCYEEIIEDPSLLHWFPWEEWIFLCTKTFILVALWFRIVSEGFFCLPFFSKLVEKDWGRICYTYQSEDEWGNHQYGNPHHQWGRRGWCGHGDSFLPLWTSQDRDLWCPLHPTPAQLMWTKCGGEEEVFQHSLYP